MSGDVEALGEVLGEIRVAGAREADWWTNDEDHALLIQVLKAECVPWAEGLLASDWLAAHDAEVRDRAVREALAPVRALLDEWEAEDPTLPLDLARLRAALPDDREGEA